MIHRVIEGIGDRIRTSSLYNQEAYRELSREAERRAVIVRDNRFHIEEAVNWLVRAQDATPDRGVSRAYSAAWHPFFRARGWQRSYPETTGYIIPTFLECSQYLGRDDLKRRAAEMGDWEIAVQMPNGAVMGGVLNDAPTPAVFNTGQVILGWVALYRATEAKPYLMAAKRAGDYLIQVQNPDGGWIKGNSEFADAKATTYNARVGWALTLLGACAGETKYTAAGEKNVQFSLSQQNTNGWFRHNCLTDCNAPLLHTISYAIEGIWGAGEVLKNEEYRRRAAMSAEQLLEAIREDGSVAGRLDKDWRGTVEWSCLTGDAQLAGIWLRVYREKNDRRYLDAARRVLAFLKSTQNCVSDNPGLRGGIKGSAPFDGEYGRFEVLNWATKFYIDALLLDEGTGRVSV